MNDFDKPKRSEKLKRDANRQRIFTFVTLSPVVILACLLSIIVPLGAGAMFLMTFIHPDAGLDEYGLTSTSIVATNAQVAVLLTETNIAITQQAAELTLTPTPRPAGKSLLCTYRWASHNDPELTAQIQAALDQAGFKYESASVGAFGEDATCDDGDSFHVMERTIVIKIPGHPQHRPDTMGIEIQQILQAIEPVTIERAKSIQIVFTGENAASWSMQYEAAYDAIAAGTVMQNLYYAGLGD